ncbi:histidine phosphatase family protein [Nocardioides cynanchi]|uniref:histidine phosphatase family protein n=1 Tax=Nocardioides cynanchi TaxID=2558918 RepID=UPI001784F76F|nr:histidine phosphatase family protein [Nocardioides cynanchi]
MTAAATILVARHADAEYESHHWADEGGSLTDTGRAQAHDLGHRLAGRDVAHVWTSTYARAVQTAEIAAAALGVAVTTREALREFSVGSFSGSRADDPFAETYAAWLSGDLERRLPGGETGAQLRLRMHHVLHEIADRHRGQTVLAVSHGGLMRLALPLILTQEPADPPARLANCAVVELTVDDQHWRCVSWPPAPAEAE